MTSKLTKTGMPKLPAPIVNVDAPATPYDVLRPICRNIRFSSGFDYIDGNNRYATKRAQGYSIKMSMGQLSDESDKLAALMAGVDERLRAAGAKGYRIVATRALDINGNLSSNICVRCKD